MEKAHEKTYVFSHALFIFAKYIMMPGSKGLTSYELSHRWVEDLGTRPDMSIKFWLLTLTSYNIVLTNNII